MELLVTKMDQTKKRKECFQNSRLFRNTCHKIGHPEAKWKPMSTTNLATEHTELKKDCKHSQLNLEQARYHTIQQKMLRL